MSLLNQITEDMKIAMRNKQTKKLSTLRMLKAAIQNKEIQERRELEDDEVLALIQKEIKSYRESLEAFTKDDRIELMAETTCRIEDLSVYLPQQLTREEIVEIVSSLISELNIQSMKEKGKLMKELMPKVKGKADGKLVNEVVTELLNK